MQARAEIAAKSIVEKPAEHMTVGIDGAFAGATHSKNQRKIYVATQCLIMHAVVYAAERQDQRASNMSAVTFAPAARQWTPVAACFTRPHIPAYHS
jgi:hypothetical protein